MRFVLMKSLELQSMACPHLRSQLKSPVECPGLIGLSDIRGSVENHLTA